MAAASVASTTGCNAGGARAPRPATPFAFAEATIADLAGAMTKGTLTSRELTEAYLARIASIDRAGPTLRAVLELDPDALAAADALDAERRSKGARGPLHGIPLLIKDNIDTIGRLHTTAGSLALMDAPPAVDATVVARLRAAGAVILGKSNLSEWANCRDSHSTSGWSARGGLTKNPYCLDRNTSGSSSGSAAAVSADLVAAAIGTETWGSIMSPSSICGIVGLKPTVGLVSRAGIIPISHTTDTAGPMTRTVADAAAVLSAIAGVDPRDPATVGARVERDYTKALVEGGAKGARIGVVRNLAWLTPDEERVYQRAIDVLRGLGAVIVDPAPLAPFKAFDEGETMLLTEMKVGMARYLSTRPGQPLRTLDDLVRFNEAHAADEMSWFGQDLFEKALKTEGLESAAYQDALAKCRKNAREEGIDAALAAQKLDALVGPTGGPAWTSDFVCADHFGGGLAWAAIAGYPSLTVPCGDTHGLPLGLTFFAGAWSEPTLLRLAYAYERATRHRSAPRYLASIPSRA